MHKCVVCGTYCLINKVFLKPIDTPSDKTKYWHLCRRHHIEFSSLGLADFVRRYCLIDSMYDLGYERLNGRWIKTDFSIPL